MAFQVVTEPLPLTEKCLHYDSIEEVPWDIQKYWHQRYSIFNFYDYDIRMTNDAWFGVTPEPVASRIAKELRALSPPQQTTVVDLFAGAGGNSIAFALTEQWDRVIAIEKDADTLACAMHNAEVHGVRDAITWIHGDCFEWLAAAKADAAARASGISSSMPPVPAAVQIDLDTTALFASPPWGGVSYRNQDVFDLSTMHPYNLEQLHTACSPLSHALYLPRTSDLRQIAKLVPAGIKVDMVQYCMEGASKALVAYMPAAAGYNMSKLQHGQK